MACVGRCRQLTQSLVEQALQPGRQQGPVTAHLEGGPLITQCLQILVALLQLTCHRGAVRHHLTDAVQPDLDQYHHGEDCGAGRGVPDQHDRGEDRR